MWFMYLVIGLMVVGFFVQLGTNAKTTIPHKCEHCNNAIKIHPNQQAMLNNGGKIECPICKHWTH